MGYLSIYNFFITEIIAGPPPPPFAAIKLTEQVKNKPVT